MNVGNKIFLTANSDQNTTHVALVDDEEDIVSILEQILSDLPVVIHSFTDPQKALDYFRQNPDQIKLLITDYKMPQMSGLEFIRSIRELKDSMRIIVISAFAPTEREIHSAETELSVSEVITKPFGIEEMIHAVQKQLDVIWMAPKNGDIS